MKLGKVNRKRLAIKIAKSEKYPQFSIPLPSDWEIPKIPPMNGFTSELGDDDFPSSKEWNVLDDKLNALLWENYGKISNLHHFYIVKIENNRIFFCGRYGIWWGTVGRFLKNGGRVYYPGTFDRTTLDMFGFKFWGVLVSSDIYYKFFYYVEKLGDEEVDRFWKDTSRKEQKEIFMKWVIENNHKYILVEDAGEAWVETWNKMGR